MAKSSKISGIKLQKKELFIRTTDDWQHMTTFSHESLLETFSAIKSKSQEIKDQMAIKSNNTGERRNINFIIDLNLETQIVTRADDEGTKKFLIKPEKPFDRELEYILDDKDFETEATEDEEEFLKECGRVEKEKKDAASIIQGKVVGISNGINNINLINKNSISAGKRLNSSEVEFIDNSLSNLTTSEDVEKKTKRRKVVKGETSSSIIDGKKEEAKQTNKPIGAETQTTKINNKIINTRKATSTKKTAAMTTKTAHATTGKRKRNIFSNFTPNLSKPLTNQEFNLPYSDYIVVNNPLQEIRKSRNELIFYDITGEEKKNMKFSINVKKKKAVEKRNAFLDKYFVREEDLDDESDLKF